MGLELAPTQRWLDVAPLPALGFGPGGYRGVRTEPLPSAGDAVAGGGGAGSRERRRPRATRRALEGHTMKHPFLLVYLRRRRRLGLLQLRRRPPGGPGPVLRAASRAAHRAGRCRRLGWRAGGPVAPGAHRGAACGTPTSARPPGISPSTSSTARAVPRTRLPRSSRSSPRAHLHNHLIGGRYARRTSTGPRTTATAIHTTTFAAVYATSAPPRTHTVPYMGASTTHVGAWSMEVLRARRR